MSVKESDDLEWAPMPLLPLDDKSVPVSTANNQVTAVRPHATTSVTTHDHGDDLDLLPLVSPEGSSDLSEDQLAHIARLDKPFPDSYTRKVDTLRSLAGEDGDLPEESNELLIELEAEPSSPGEQNPTLRFEPKVDLGKIDEVLAIALSRIRRNLDSGDASGALAAAEQIIAALGGVEEVHSSHHELLALAYQAQLGGIDGVPVIDSQPESLNPQTAFLLSRIDGLLTVDEVMEVGGVQPLQTLRTLALWSKAGHVRIR